MALRTGTLQSFCPVHGQSSTWHKNLALGRALKMGQSPGHCPVTTTSDISPLKASETGLPASPRWGFCLWSFPEIWEPWSHGEGGDGGVLAFPELVFGASVQRAWSPLS